MRKHIKNVVSSIRSNPWQFVGVFLISLVLTYFIYITFYRICYLPPVQFGILIPIQLIHQLLVTFLLNIGVNIINVIWVLLVLGISLAVGVFASTGYLHCLELKDKKDDWMKTFFREGVKGFPKAFYTTVLNFLILVGITSLIVLLYATVFPIIELELITFSMYFLILIVVLLSNFFVFMVFEAVFSKKKVTKLIPDACKKALKVFGKLAIISIFTWIFFFASLKFFMIFVELDWWTFYVVAAYVSLIHILSVTFFYYPLYKNATELLGEKSDVNTRVHKTEYIGSDNYVFHKTSCWHVKQIAPGTEDYFETREEAINKGYEPCKHCRP